MTRTLRMLLLTIGLVAVLIIPVTASAHPPKVTYGAQQNFQPAAGYPTPPYPLTLRRTKFSAHEWCWGGELYDASTDTFGPYDASLAPPIFPAPLGLDGGDECGDPTLADYAITGSSTRAVNLYGTFGPATIIKTIKINPAVRNLRLNLPNGSVVKLKFVKQTILWATNTQLGPVTLTYELNGVDTTTREF